MASTKRLFARLLPRSRILPLSLLFMLFIGAPVFSQNTNASPLAAEIGDMERKLASDMTGAERRETWTKLARLQRLSGNVDAAARAWREAALADPENRDDRSLLESSLCYLALGEFDAASDALRGVMAGAADSAAYRDARYIGAQIELFRSGNAAALYALLSQPEYGQYRPAIYYTFWRFFGDEAYKIQTLTEFPDSPEARILQSEAALSLNSGAGGFGPGTVSALPRPLWFLYPGRGNVFIGRPVQVQPPEVPRQHELSSPVAGPKALQTGLFSREENAQAAATRLAARGFAAEVDRKTVNGVVYWAVSVAPGKDPNQTIMRLKDAGFESFPVF
ncbi:MAG: SPOR domain-containing protein [Treponema sp.]|jgi:tetratricopeptide (TPR) repeat protein|nr:SPOR domain-containing protein [Treponema sp.]